MIKSRLITDSSGTSYLETLIILPILFLLLSLIIQIGIYFTVYFKASRMAYEGARMAAGIADLPDNSCQKAYLSNDIKEVCTSPPCNAAPEEYIEIFGRLQDMILEYEKGAKLYHINWSNTAIVTTKQGKKITVRVSLLNTSGVWNALLAPIGKAFGAPYGLFSEAISVAEAPYLLDD